MSRDQTILHSERQALCTAMARPSSLPEMAIRKEHFVSEQHATIWEAIQTLSMDGKPIDGVTVMDWLDKEGQRGASHLALDIAGHDTPSSAPAYVSALIVTAWRGREAQRIGMELTEAAKRREDGAVDRAIASLMSLNFEDRDCEHTAKGAMRAAMAQVQAAIDAGGALIGIPTGISGLDETLGGFHNSDLIVIGGRPAMGKTGLLFCSVLAGSDVGPVGLISGEQPVDQVGMRWLANGSGVSVGRLRAARIDDESWPTMLATVAKHSDRFIKIYDRTGPDIADVIRVARRWKHQYGIRALYVDYLQKLEISGMGQAPKHERVGAIARSLKNLARDLQIPVIALAQVSRKVDDRQNQRPGMSDLADSSEIEKEADQIMTLWRDTTNPHAESSPAEIIVAKNRHGNIGTVHCIWRGAQTAFVDVIEDKNKF